MTTTYFICPHCGTQDKTDMDVLAVDFDNGCPISYFPTVDLAKARERHIDTRVCCQGCWKRAGRMAALANEAHPYSGTYHEQRRARSVGQVIGAPAVHKE